MIPFFIYLGIVLYLHLSGAPHEIVFGVSHFLLIVYFVCRLIGNLLFDADARSLSRENDRRNMSSGYFSMSVDKDGKYIIKTNGDERDHSQRCVDSLNEGYEEEKLVKGFNWFYGIMIVLLLVIPF